MFPVALLVCFVTFMTIHLIPGDPARVLLGEFATPQAIEALHQQLGLDKPLPSQFALWLWQALHGNLGQSIQLQQSVLDAILQRLPVTAELGICSLLFFFAVDIRLFPPGGYVSFDEDAPGNIHDLILPMVTLGAGAVALNMRQIRASMIEALSQDYIRTARAKGLSERRVSYLHALRNAIIPVLTIVGLQVGTILAGAFVIETIFLWPGIGQLAVTSILAKDYPVVQGVVLLSALSYMAANLLVDICYAVLDPRIRFDKR